MTLSVIFMGVFVGFMVGLTGVGGASLLTPILILIGIHPSIAVGTDLFYNSITKLFGTIQHWRQKTIDFKLVKMLAMGSIPGVIAAVVFLKLFNSFFHNQENIIKHALGYVLILVAFATLFKVFFGHKIKENRWQLQSLEEKRGLTITIGAVLGFVVGLTSIGSGSLYAIAMLYFFRMNPAQLVGTDIAHAFFLATTAGILHASMGNVNYTLVLNLLTGSIPGVVIGSMLSTKAPTAILRTIIASLVLISGLKLIG
ncbi:sulfite exporter TauE/SafE family protein [Paenibacillus alginolyticus]|uniref:Probable membrane transporter protein n=1 Tax=Paenibacillus alginolyticus TaxID=59839 RepID=A0ABT4GP07_9BACL|nr:sulfite exporter TauE/SafE family protein [Paenibacillus alginolyticus]MCY9669003.1 sulfite exporter TauE/SafE family protein [Paenibacillus alginolyticus]MCY9697949.1 sulfite exporter TauE/SafE family protein [Paenibacillus alginolyticus]MEC0147602.1 sulfite exporter TauE/SafE family protein [Paenibacillus alginolyticus]